MELPPIFQFDHTDELFQISHFDFIPCSQLQRTEEDQPPIISNPFQDFQNLPKTLKFEENPNPDEIDEKKMRNIIHRDIERQRRQEMAKLYASLRSLLPLQYLKGKRSISDQIDESVKYIKDLEKRIKELRDKRDELKKYLYATTTTSSSLSNSPSCIASQNLKISNSDSSIINIRGSRAGVLEVIINTDLKQGLSLSRVLEILADEGYTIISCLSAKVNQRLLHTIQSQYEVGGWRTKDLSELERKLTDKAYDDLVLKRASEYGVIEIWMNQRVKRAYSNIYVDFLYGFLETLGESNQNGNLSRKPNICERRTTRATSGSSSLSSTEPVNTFLSRHAQSVRALLCIGPASNIAPDFLHHLPSLELIVAASAGVDHIDLTECRRRSIAITNASSAFPEPVAEYAFALLMNVLCRLSASDRYVRSSLWLQMREFPLGFKVGDRRIGIVGLGNIGSEIAKRLEPFGCSIAYNSRKKKPYASYTYYDNVHDLAVNSDVLMVCCAVTDKGSVS